MKTDRRCLLLDFDGTLADSLDAMWQAYSIFLQHCGKDPSQEEFESLNGPPLSVIVETLRNTHEIPLSQAEALALYQEEIEAALPAMRPASGAHRLLDTARSEGWRTGIVTSNDRSRVARWLDRFSLSECIDIVIGGDVRPGKPSPAPYLAALERLGCQAPAAIAVEDSASGYEAAAAAKIPVLFYRPFNRPPGPAGATCVPSLPAISATLPGKDERVSIRLALDTDLPFLYGLRNDPSAVKNFRTARPLRAIELESRFTFDPTLIKRIVLVAEAGNEPVAMIRFDQMTGAYLVSIIVHKQHRGHGLGLQVLQAAIDALFAMHGPVKVAADVVPGNPASARLFEKAGFQRTSQGDEAFLHFTLNAQAPEKAERPAQP